MQQKNANGKGGVYHKQGQNQQPKAPQQAAQDPRHHNSVVGLYTHQQQAKTAKILAPLNLELGAPQGRGLGQ